MYKMHFLVTVFKQGTSFMVFKLGIEHIMCYKHQLDYLTEKSILHFVTFSSLRKYSTNEKKKKNQTNKQRKPTWDFIFYMQVKKYCTAATHLK